MKPKRILTTTVVFLAVMALASGAYSHDGEDHGDIGHDRSDRMLFDEGSGSNALGEYEKRHAKPAYKEEGSGGDQAMPATAAPVIKEEGSGSLEYDPRAMQERARKKLEEEGSGGRRGFPSN